MAESNQSEGDFIKRMLARKGYTSPGQSMNVATAESFIRTAMTEAQIQEQKAANRRCSKCRERYEIERRVF